VAEDLGVITPEVEGLRDRWELPGMKILQFAFGSGATNPYLPHNHCRRSVVYTGTHDNDTTAGWFAALSPKEKKHVLTYLEAEEEEMPHALVRAALASVASLAVVPFQDLVGLGTDARMNLPGTARGNWEWRCTREMFFTDIAVKIHELTKLFGRI
jgi:4-alpha-glucanotransferase